MRGLAAVTRREVSALFGTPLAWLLLAVLLLVNGLMVHFFLWNFEGNVTATLEFAMGVYPVFWVVLAIVPPILTMNMLAGEARSGTMEYLQTAPITDGAIVTGKFLAATLFMAVLWSSFILYGFLFGLLGTTPDWGPLLGGYIGLVLTSGFFCSVGIFASSSVDHPVPAVLIGFVCNLLLLSLPGLIGLLPPGGEMLETALELGDVRSHFDKSFSIGILDSGPIAFFLATTGLFLFLAARLLELKRWW